MDNKGKNYFRKPGNGSLFPTVLAFAGMAAGFGYLFLQKEKAKKAKTEIVEPKQIEEPKKVQEKKFIDASESYLNK